MAGVIKLFHTTQMFCKALGLDTPRLHCLKHSLNAKTVFHLIFLAQLFVSSSAFFFFDAKTIDEYGMSFYVSITYLSFTINIMTFAWQMTNITTQIEKYEEFTKKS